MLIDNQYTTMACLHRRISIPLMLQHWVLCFLGNLAGSLFVVCIICGYGGVFDAPVYRKEVQTFATMKQVTPNFRQIFLRGIGANWLVCLACFLGSSGRDLASKIVGIWWPTFAFVSLALDHGMFFMLYVLANYLLMVNLDRCRKYVLHPYGYLAPNSRSQRGPVHLEGHDSDSTRKFGRWRIVRRCISLVLLLAGEHRSDRWCGI